jgi:hypothetical protein
MPTGAEHPLELTEGTQKALDHLPASPELKQALDTERITWANICKALNSDPSAADTEAMKLFSGNNIFDFTVNPGDTFNQSLALNMCGKGYGQLSTDQRYLVTTIEMILKEQGVNVSALQIGDKVSFNFENGTYSYTHVETPTDAQTGELERKDRVEVKEKSVAERERLLTELAHSGSLFEAMRAYGDNPTYAGRVAFLKAHEGFADLVNAQLPAGSAERFDASKSNFGYKESNNATQNIAFLRAYIKFQREALQAEAAPAPVEPVVPVAPTRPAPVAPELSGAPTVRIDNKASEATPPPLSTTPPPLPVAPPPLPPEAAGEPLDRDAFLDKQWDERIRPQIDQIAKEYPELRIRVYEPTPRNAFKGDLLTRDSATERDPWPNYITDHSKSVEVTNLLTGETRLIRVYVRPRTSGYDEASVSLSVAMDHKEIASTSGDKTSVPALLRRTADSMCSPEAGRARLEYDMEHFSELPLDRQVYWLDMAATDYLSNARMVTKDSPARERKMVSSYGGVLNDFERWLSQIKAAPGANEKYATEIARIGLRLDNLHDVLEEKSDFLGKSRELRNAGGLSGAATEDMTAYKAQVEAMNLQTATEALEKEKDPSKRALLQERITQLSK